MIKPFNNVGIEAIPLNLMRIVSETMYQISDTKKNVKVIHFKIKNKKIIPGISEQCTAKVKKIVRLKNRKILSMFQNYMICYLEKHKRIHR